MITAFEIKGKAEEADMKILNVSAHMGGGVGKAVYGIVDTAGTDVENRILLLEEPVKCFYVDQCREKNIDVYVDRGDRQQTIDLLDWADVIVMNWWNHPAMTRFMMDFPEMETRMVLWCHINGCTYPFLPYHFTTLFHKILFTTEYSRHNPLWNDLQCSEIAGKSEVIYGMGDFQAEEILPKTDYSIHGRFVIGYAGTINYAKMHGGYLSFCRSVADRIKDVCFLMVGDADEDFVRDVRQNGMEEYFVFTGYVEDVYPYYRKMDVLGYLLAEENYATTENVLLEAMAAGVPVVAFGNKPEEYIVNCGNNGFLVYSKEEYVDIILRLYRSEELRQKTGQSARTDVMLRYSCEKNKEKYYRTLREVCLGEKTEIPFLPVMGRSAFQWFLACTGRDREFLETFQEKTDEEKIEFFRHCPEVYLKETKGSIRHYGAYFADREIDRMIEFMDGNVHR